MFAVRPVFNPEYTESDDSSALKAIYMKGHLFRIVMDVLRSNLTKHSIFK